MKTTRIISALSLVLVFAATSLFANRISDPPADKRQSVSYEVKVNFAPNFPGAGGQYLIAITDETGRRMVPAKPYHPGVSVYTFKEAGDFKGTRIAVLIPYPANQSGWTATPCVLNGWFAGGASYRFVLTPKSNVRWDPAGNGN